MTHQNWLKSALIAGVAIFLFGTFTPAFAQDAAEGESEEGTDERPALVAKEEIVVTATRTERRMVEVPM